ncbi:hypothetical protein NKI59_07715 [Mesorhizobium sp. M0598]|uniref:hypothetical protein n=1 Tax=Mesorhizobium sp. M0598 TaxID=2956968 RepID=UPI00333AC45B
MVLNQIFATLMILAVAATSCVYLIPKTSQDRMDEKVHALSEGVRELTCWNFATIERDIAFSWLQAIFGASVNNPRFYLNVALYAAYATAIALVPYLFIPFSDPLNVSLVGFPAFLLMGFFVPSMIVAVISMGFTIALLSIGARLKNGIFYLFIVAIDMLVVATLIAALSVNLELTRDYLEGVYLGQIDTNRWLAVYQPFLAIEHVVRHPSVIIPSIHAELYTSSKYTTYIVSIMAMVCAITPGIIHLVCAVFIASMAIFHNVMKHVASFLLARMYEQRTFKFLGWFFGLPAACIKILEVVFSKSV